VTLALTGSLVLGIVVVAAIVSTRRASRHEPAFDALAAPSPAVDDRVGAGSEGSKYVVDAAAERTPIDATKATPHEASRSNGSPGATRVTAPAIDMRRPLERAPETDPDTGTDPVTGDRAIAVDAGRNPEPVEPTIQVDAEITPSAAAAPVHRTNSLPAAKKQPDRNVIINPFRGKKGSR